MFQDFAQPLDEYWVSSFNIIFTFPDILLNPKKIKKKDTSGWLLWPPQYCRIMSTYCNYDQLLFYLIRE